MDSWSPLRSAAKRRSESPLRKARGRRRQHLAPAPDSPDVILTDADAAAAADSARTGRDRAPRPAWERFASEPVRPRGRGDQLDASDVIMTAGQAEQAGHDAFIRPDVTAGRVSQLVRDYGTGPAYEPGNMR